MLKSEITMIENNNGSHGADMPENSEVCLNEYCEQSICSALESMASEYFPELDKTCEKYLDILGSGSEKYPDTLRSESFKSGDPLSQCGRILTEEDFIRVLSLPELYSEPFDVNSIRKDFPILEEKVGGRDLIWFDNAATTQKPRTVIERLKYFYEHENSNVHRSAHTLASRTTDAYEGARRKIAAFLMQKARMRSCLYAVQRKASTLLHNPTVGRTCRKETK
jgi:hypothetical protein